MGPYRIDRAWGGAKLKITQFSVSRYRSIIEAEKITFGQHTILIGKNNEGKSNILRAIRTAIEAIRYYSVSIDGRNPRGRRLYTAEGRTLAFRFDWTSDFPIPLQEAKAGNKKTRFRIDFGLDDSEVDEFHEKFNLTLNSQLPIVIEISQSGDLDLSIAKPGKGNISFGKKVKEICGFITEKIEFIYVPAVRTDKDAMQVIADLLRSTLLEVERQPEYQRAVDEILKAQKPTLDRIANDIGDRLKKFIPSIKSVSIDTSIRRIYTSLSRDIELTIDDGVATHLDAKGDGIKSLVALSLFHSNPTLGKSRIVAIEEPESHLHHGAVHELKRVLQDLSSDGQVIISSHNPSFVDRDSLANVILVDGGRAEKVKSIEKLRRSLGVLVSDNLINSEFSIICEGRTDSRAIRHILSSISSRLRSLIASGALVIDDLHLNFRTGYRR
jgi:AAA15 family ATPase/GTPase